MSKMVALSPKRMPPILFLDLEEMIQRLSLFTRQLTSKAETKKEGDFPLPKIDGRWI